MRDAIVVLNAGSTSLKFSVFQAGDDRLSLAVRGHLGGLGSAPYFQATDRMQRVMADEKLTWAASPGAGHAAAFEHMMRWTTERFRGLLSPVAVGHLVAHGGAEFAGPTLLSDGVTEELEALVPLAPTHQPHNLAVVRLAKRLLPDLPQVACFDTAFHQGRAAVTERFGLASNWYDRGIRRWGFHGLSCASVISQLQEVAPEVAAGKVIVAHLGSTASIRAIKGGRSVDTTMGFSELDGLPMGTRCGSLDPGVVLFLMKSHNYQEVESMLCRESGLLGISGISGDVHELLASDSGRAAEAIEYFVYRAVREIGSLAAAMGGIDALVFTAGIGENSPAIRERICRPLKWLGISLEGSAVKRERGCISMQGRSPSVWLIPTDEERVIADSTWAIVRKS